MTKYKTIQSLVNTQVWGERASNRYVLREGEKDHPSHVNCKERLNNFFQKIYTKQVIQKWDRIAELPQYKIKLHEADKTTLYFTAASENTLLLIDIDCHHSGTLTGAKDYAAELVKNWNKLFTESSTNGGGIHGYLIVNRTGWSDTDYNDLCARLETALTLIQKNMGADIEMVEVKGRSAVIDFPKVINMGQLGKLPRNVEAALQTERITAWDLSVWADSIIEKLTPVQPVVIAAKQTKKPVGSCCIITEEDYEQGLSMMRSLYPSELKHPKYKNLKITLEDAAAFATILTWCQAHPNEDGSQPTDRFKKIWNIMLDSGIITRAWQHNRYKFLRDWFTTNGLIEWQDSTYVPPTWSNGEKVKGRAAQWNASETFNQLKEREKKYLDCKHITSHSVELLPLQQFDLITPIIVYSTPLKWHEQQELLDFIIPMAA